MGALTRARVTLGTVVVALLLLCEVFAGGQVILVPSSGLFANGTAAAPSLAFASEPGLGWYRSAAGNMALADDLYSTTFTGFIIGSSAFAQVASIGGLRWSGTTDAAQATDTGLSRSSAGLLSVGNGTQGDASGNLQLNTLLATTLKTGASNVILLGPANGTLNVTNNANTIGSQLKVDALPTVASGFGTSPSITAGSTPLAGSVNVGTGGVAVSGIINWNGTAFPSAPFVTCLNTTTAAILRCVSSTTQLTITAPVAFVASDVIVWQAISSK